MDHLEHDMLDKDTAYLGQIFPVEIWKIVARKQPTRKSFINSSPFFRNILTTERTLYIFRKVLALLTKYFWESGHPDVLSVQDILKCRQVCKIWNVGIDKFILKSCHYSKATTNVNKILQSNINYEFWHEDPNDGTVFPREIVFNYLEHFESAHSEDFQQRSPFVLPKLLVNIPSFDDLYVKVEEELNRYLDGISTLLQIYGEQVTDFTVELFSSWFGLEYAVCIQKWLVLMPNLVHLEIRDNTEYSDIETLELQQFFQSTPFPTLNWLEKIKVRQFNAPLFNHLIEQNNHILDLHVKDGEESYDIFRFELPQLKNFKIEFAKDLHYIPDNLNCRQNKWPVTTLHINLENLKTISGCKDFFQAVQAKFADTLEMLSLKLPKAWKKSGSMASQNFNDLQLCLPHLMEIDLRTSAPTSLDFLLPMKNNLECIFVDVRYALPKTGQLVKESVVEFRGFESNDRIVNSNIWTIFKKLIRIGIRRRGPMGTKYLHRKDWKQRNK